MAPRSETERKKVKGLNYTRNLLGAAETNDHIYIVRFFADNRTQHNRTNEIEYDYDILYSIAKDEIKKPAKAAYAVTAYGGKNHTGGTLAGTISIMDLLNHVKEAASAQTGQHLPFIQAKRQERQLSRTASMTKHVPGTHLLSSILYHILTEVAITAVIMPRIPHKTATPPVQPDRRGGLMFPAVSGLPAQAASGNYDSFLSSFMNTMGCWRDTAEAAP